MPNQQSVITNEHTSESPRRKTVLAIASAGGHWVQLSRLRPAFANSRLIFATTRESYRAEVSDAEFRVIPDCNRWQKFKLLKSALSITWLIIKEKPAVIVTTGAAPGYFAIRIGKLLGKRTVWVDSIANAEELSLSGQKAGKHVDKWITQWKHLEKPSGPKYFGNVIGEQIEHEPAKPETSETEDAKQIKKIFVTVGTDLPFDRLVKAVDQWAEGKPQYEIFAQIGESRYQPKHISYSTFLEPPEFKKRFQDADLILSHAGMGTILSSLNFQKSLLVMPRIAAKGEHRNEHQLATAKHLKALNRINVASDETALIKVLESMETLPAKAPIGPYASQQLTSEIARFIAAS